MTAVSRMHRPFPTTGRQRGAVLLVALVLLPVIMLLAMAASRSTLLQERMSANSYDRMLAFQRSESALRAAEAAITADWRISNLGGVDCSPESLNLCLVVPANTFTSSDANWRNVAAQYDINDATTPATPQYQVQLMGMGPGEDDLGLSANADYGGYGNPYPPDEIAYYRVTARSSDPEATDDRSIVVLQTTVRRAF